MSKKINIEPFNEYYFKSCFYNSLIALMRNYSLDNVEDLLSNFIPYYNFENENEYGQLGIEYNLMFLDQQGYQNLGLNVELELVTDNVIEKLKRSIDKDIPVIVDVDCFLLPHCEEYYLKQSRKHVLTVCGYDDDRQVFHIIDQAKFNTLTYTQIEIGYDDLRNSIISYFDKFPNSQSLSVNFIYVSPYLDNEPQNGSRVIFDELLRKNHINYSEGISQLEIFLSFIERALDEGMYSKLLNENVVNGLNDIINSKKAILIIYDRKNDPKINHIKSLINMWSEIRSNVLYCIIRGQQNEVKISKVLKSLHEIVITEKKYITEVMEGIN